MAASSDDSPSWEEVKQLVFEWENLEDEVERLKQRLESTEQDEMGKQAMKDINLKDIRMKLAGAIYGKAYNMYFQRDWEEVRANRLQSGLDVTSVDGEIRHYKEAVVKYEEEIKQHQQRLLEMEQEEELERRNKRLLKERLKQGSVKMRYLVCITIGLPGVGKTCLKFLLMEEPPPELRSSTILSERPIRIEVSIRKISEMKIRASGERWEKVTDKDILDIVGGLIILASKQHPGSVNFPTEESTVKEPVVVEEIDKPAAITAPRVGFLQKILNLVSKRKPELSYPPQPQPSEPTAKIQQVSDLSSEACRKAVDTIMNRLAEVIKRLKDSSQSSEHVVQPLSRDRHNVPRSDWVLFSDCGGQPKYHELLPLFMQHISAALCVLRLTDSLDKVQPVEYYSEDKPLCLPAQSQLSAKDTIMCLVNTVQSFSTQNQKPKVIFVGTHLDEFQEKKCDLQKHVSATTKSLPQAKSSEHLETLQEKNNVLIDMLQSEFSDHLVYYSENMKQLLYPVNTMKRGEEELKIAKLIREAVEKSPAQEVEVPVWWLIFEMLLQELAKLLERKVLSKAECLELARTLGFGARELEAVLLYFDKINVIRYSPKVLPNVIFAESQIPLEKVSEYIKKSYILRGEAAADFSPTEGKLKYFRDHGVINRELMSEFRLHYVEGIFKEEDLAALLVERLIFAQIPTPPWALPPPDDEQSQNDPQPSDVSQSPMCSDTTSPEEPPKESYYFMASSLMTLTEAELKQHRRSSPSVATLLVKFPKGQRRAGVFCCFASYVICQCGWDIILDAKVPLYRNCIKFHPKRISPPVTVTVIDSDSFIEVHANISRGATDTECAQLLPILKGAVFAGITAACVALKYQRTHPELGFFCPHHEAEDQGLHFASIRPNRLYWCCDVDPTVNDRLEKRHHLWFGMNPDPQRLAEAHASLPTSMNRPQASPASNPPTINTYAKVATHEDSTKQQTSTAATSTLATLPTTTDQLPLQSSRNTAASHPLLPTHSSMSSSDPGAHQSSMQSTTTTFSHARPSTSSAANLPEIPDITRVTSQPATSQPTQQHLLDTAVSTAPSPNLTSSNMRPSMTPASSTTSIPIPQESDHSSEESTVFKKPALHELERLEGQGKVVKVIKGVADKWKQFAMRLHFEFNDIRRIEKDNHHQQVDACLNVVGEWLSGEGRKPVTWMTLITVLNEIELSELAKDLESALETHM